MKIPQSVIDEVRRRSSASLVEIVSEDVPLKRAGREFMACCPFHDEKTPSFSVVPRKGFFYCHGCGESGDAIKWLEKRRGMDFHSAVRHLASRFGIEIPDREDRQAHRQLSRREQERRARFELLSHVADIALEFADGEEPVPAIEGAPISGVLPPLQEVVRRLRARGFTNEQLRDVGITRTLAEDPAWIEGGPVVWAGSPEAVFAMRPLSSGDAGVIGVAGSESAGWVGLESATAQGRKDGTILIAADAGALQALRTRVGQATMMPIGKVRRESLEYAIPASADPIVTVSPDGEARRRALRLSLRISELAPRVGVVELPADPDLLTEAYLAQAIDGAGNIFEWQAKLMKAHGAFKTEEGRKWAAGRLARVIDRIPVEVGALERDLYASMLKRITGVTYEEAKELSAARTQTPAAPAQPSRDTSRRTARV